MTADPKLAQLRRAAAARQRAYQRRQARGRILVKFEINEHALINALKRAGLLDEADALDTAAVGQASSRALRRWIKSQAI